MKWTILPVFFFVNLVYSLSFDDVKGIWILPKNDRGERIVAEIFEKNGELFSLGFAYKSLKKEKKRDVLNPNPALRSRFLDEVVFVTNLKIEDSAMVKGEIYNPEKGKYYYLTGTLSSNKDTIEWVASIDKSHKCSKKIIWTRLKNPDKYTKFQKTQLYLESKILPRTLKN